LRESLSTLRYAAKANTIQRNSFGGEQDPRNNLICKLKEELVMLRKIATSKLSENAHHAAETLVFQVYAHPLVIHKKTVINNWLKEK
jgi:hypothetical protein